MQQLVGDRPSCLIARSFVSCFSNVRMVLASTPEDTTLDKLAELADKLMEVAIPSVATVSASLAVVPPSTSLVTEMEQMRSEILRLEKLINKLARSRSSSRSTPHSPRRSSTPSPQPETHQILSVGITTSMVSKLRSARPLVPGREMDWPGNGLAGR